MIDKPFIERTDKAISLEDVTPEMHAWLFDDEANERFDREARLLRLREEFEAEIDLIATMIEPRVFDPVAMKDPDAFHETWANVYLPEPCELRAIQAARRYIIARDFNEFDPQRADMLWKLQNGGAV